MLEPDPKDNPNPAITVDPPWAARRLISWFLRRTINPERRTKQRRAIEAERLKSGAPHRVHYFHQLDDPYSHLAVQKLQALVASYDIDLVPHLIRATGGKNQPYPEALAEYARRDAAAIAPHYQIYFPGNAGRQPDQAAQQMAAALFANQLESGFAQNAARISDALWSGDRDQLNQLSQELGQASDQETKAALDAGSAEIQKQGHYSGGTFLYGGEWYWGVDRICHLEKRLTELGARRAPDSAPVAPRPAIDPGPRGANGQISLEFFPSLRSPYTAIIFDKTCELADQSGVDFQIKPVLPMVMRGVPATRTKGQYIFSDTLREAEALGVPFGNVFDPIGKPVRRAYALFPWARSEGKGAELLSAFLRCAFAERVPVDTDKGLRQVVEQAGLSWKEAQQHLGNTKWRDEIEANQNEMTEEIGLWGVPSFRITGPQNEPDFTAWGQDRLWLVAAEIKRRVALLP